MSDANRLKGLQGLIFTPYREPEFIPTQSSLRFAAAKHFAAQKLFSGWSAYDVIDYLVTFNGFSSAQARKIVAPLYNRLTTPIKELRRGDL